MNSISKNLQHIQTQIAESARASNRNPGEISLVAVSKTKTSADIQVAYEAGLRIFAENRVQEILQKFNPPFRDDVEVHMIGHLQSNKVKQAVRLCSWIQSVDSVKLLKKISHYAIEMKKNIQLCMEINTSGETSKYGLCDGDELYRLLDAAMGLENIRLRGLMTIGPLRSRGENPLRKAFSDLRELHRGCTPRFDLPHWDTLSMGMSNDFDIAITEGATMVRVGTGIFGARDYGEKK